MQETSSFYNWIALSRIVSMAIALTIFVFFIHRSRIEGTNKAIATILLIIGIVVHLTFAYLWGKQKNLW